MYPIQTYGLRYITIAAQRYTIFACKNPINSQKTFGCEHFVFIFAVPILGHDN